MSPQYVMCEVDQCAVLIAQLVLKTAQHLSQCNPSMIKVKDASDDNDGHEVDQCGVLIS